MDKLKVMTIFGTRPEAIKMAPLVKELENRPEFESCCCVTAQHRQMLDTVLGIFQITPEFDLDIMEQSQTLSTITSKCLLGLEGVFQQVRPDLVLVHGDTSTTFAGALAAFYQQIAIGHVEAGLRTGDKYSPFPEEMNRSMVGRLADLHFCPTQANRRNLAAEGMNLIIDDNDHQLIIKVASIPSARVQIYFIDNDDYFARKAVLRDEKGDFFPDNDERAIFFARGVLETVKKLRWTPTVVHCHGWFSAITPIYLKKVFADDPIFRNVKVVVSLYGDGFPGELDGGLRAKIANEGVKDKNLSISSGRSK